MVFVLNFIKYAALVFTTAIYCGNLILLLLGFGFKDDKKSKNNSNKALSLQQL